MSRKTSFRWVAAALAAGLTLSAAAPAYARVSIGRAESLCEAAALARDPAPARVRARAEGSNREQVRVSLDLFDAAGVRTEAVCVVNRDSGEAVITLS